LARLYRQAAEITGDADVAVANQAHDELHEAYKLLSSTPQGREAIQRLMIDQNPRVQCWAAAHSLFWVPDTARSVLEALASGDDFLAFEAKITLREFDAGRLTFDY
jgi:hypothetical protein